MASALETLIENQQIILQWIENYNSNKKKFSQFQQAQNVDANTIIPVEIAGSVLKAPLSLISDFVSSAIRLRQYDYDDIQSMLDDQSFQTEGKVQFVEDAGDDPELSQGEYAYYEFLGTQNANLQIDYKRLSGAEIEAVQNAESYFTIRTERVHPTSISDIVQSNNLQAKYNSTTSKIEYIVFGRGMTKALLGFKNLSSDFSYVLEFRNLTKNRILLAKVNQISFSNVSEQCVRFDIGETIDIQDIEFEDKLLLTMSSYENLVAGVSTVSGDGVDNADPNNPVFTFPTPAQISAIDAAEKGSNDGVATLDSSGKVPSAQLPSYVDDVLEFTDAVSFPAIGETGIVYIAENTNLSYRWTGSIYVKINDLSGSEIKSLLFAEADTNNLSDALLSKLNNIENNATADQTGAEIKTLYESEADTNVFTDEEKNKLSSRLNTQPSVSGTFDLNYRDFEEFKLTLTGNTTFTESNLPASGKTKVVLLKVTGDFALTYPVGWSTDITGTYDGTVNNTIVVWYINPGEYKVQITQPD